MSIRFDNNADRFRWTSNLPSPSGATAWTIAFKCRVESDLGTGLQEVLRFGHSTNSDAAVIIAWDNGSNVMEIVSYEDGTGTLNVQSFASRPVVGKWFWLTISCAGSGANQLTGRWSYEDNVAIVSASTTIASAGNQLADNLWLGSPGFTDRCNCTIAYAGYVIGTAWNDSQHLSNKFATTAWSGAGAFITTATDGVDQSGNGNDATVSGLSAGTGEPMTTDMSFVAQRGTGVSSTSNNTLTMSPSATIAAGQLVMIAIASDNTGTSDTGSGTEVSSVADDAGGNTWTKIGEVVNGSPGAGAGVLVALFGCVLATQLTTGTTITVTFGSNRTDKCCGLVEHNWPSGQSFQVDAIDDAEATTNGFGSAVLSGLASADRLYPSAGGKEANKTTALTATSQWTNYGFTVRSRNNAAAVLMRAEFIGRTSTGETSNPTMAVSGDAAHIIAALSPVAGGSPIVIDVGLVTETESAFSVGKTKAKAAGLTSEIESALSVGKAKVKTIGLTSETQTSQELVANKSHTAGLATETSVAFDMAWSKLKAPGLVTETDNSLAATAIRKYTLGLTSETEAAFDMAWSKLKATGLCAETDNALAARPVRLYGVALVSTTEEAFEIGRAKLKALGLAAETAEAFEILVQIGSEVGLAQEDDEAFSVTRKKLKAIGLTNETDSVFTSLPKKTLSTGLASESETSFAVVVFKLRSVGATSETDSAFAVARKKLRTLGLSSEADEALDLTVVNGVQLGLPTETDSAFSLGVALKSRVPGLVTESDLALSIIRAKLKQLGLASETDAALEVLVRSTIRMLVTEITGTKDAPKIILQGVKRKSAVFNAERDIIVDITGQN